MRPGLDADARPGARDLTAVVLACCVVLAAGVIAGPLFAGSASAGDQPAVFTIEPEEVDAEPGETVELEVVVYNQGPLYGYGLSEVAFDVGYDPEVVSEATVEHGEWLAEGGDGDAELDGSATVDEAAGLISVEQAREPAGDGVFGDGPVATITLTIVEDADPTNLEVAFEDTTALIPTGAAHFVWDHGATVHVGGGDGDYGDDGDDESGSDDVDGVTLGDDADLSGTDDSDPPGVDDGDGSDHGADERGDGTNVPVPGFGALAALLALAGAGSALAIRRVR